MGFGKSPISVVKTFTEQNNGNGKNVFFPNKAGDGGSPVSTAFHHFPDVEGKEEKVILARELSVHATINGQKSQKTFRTCLVRSDNPIDTAMWEEINAIKDREDISKEDKTEMQKPFKEKLSKRVFLINVYNLDAGMVQVFKGSYEELIADEVNNLMRPKNPNGGGTVYAKMFLKLQTGLHIPDPKNKLKRIIVNDPVRLDIVQTVSGAGKRKNFEFSPVAISDLPDEVIILPRYKIEAWVQDGVGIWPNEAIEKVINGHDFYQVAQEYGVQLYPELEKAETSGNPDTSSETDELFDD